MTAVYLYTELEMAECRQLGQKLKHCNSPAHCTAAEGPNQHPAAIDTDIYTRAFIHAHTYTYKKKTKKNMSVQYFNRVLSLFPLS